MMEYDIHTVLDFLTLGATAWVIYTLRMPLKDTYQAEQDSVQTYYVVSHPCRVHQAAVLMPDLLRPRMCELMCM